MMSRELNIRRRVASLSRKVSREDGFGIVEALVAAIILVLVVLAMFSAYDASSHAAFDAQQSQVRLGVAQQEMEKMRALPYDEIALTYLPVYSSDPSDPLNRVQNGKFNLDRNGSDDAKMVVNGGTLIGGDPITGGVINPGPEHFQNGDVGGDIYRFVVWQRNTGCNLQVCTSQDFKRVVIIVKPDTTPAGGSRDYIEIHSDFINPQDSSVSELVPNGTQRVTGQQFWLTDTTCAPSGNTLHNDPTKETDHLLHNTLGSCANGQQFSGTPGAPDALIPAPPPGDPSLPLYDYEIDWEPLLNPLSDKGIQIQRASSSACVLNPGGSASTQASRIHRWVTDPMGSDFQMTGDTTLDFFSRTINGVSQSGQICAWLFVRPPNWPTGSDTILNPGGTAFTLYNGSWPQSWTAMTLPMNLGSPQTIPAGSRLGLAVGLAGGTVTPNPVEFMYDHPTYASRLEAQTTTPLG